MSGGGATSAPPGLSHASGSILISYSPSRCLPDRYSNPAKPLSPLCLAPRDHRHALSAPPAGSAHTTVTGGPHAHHQLAAVPQRSKELRPGAADGDAWQYGKGDGAPGRSRDGCGGVFEGGAGAGEGRARRGGQYGYGLSPCQIHALGVEPCLQWSNVSIKMLSVRV